jgi:uncharacterized protein (TIGR03663 family)
MKSTYVHILKNKFFLISLAIFIMGIFLRVYHITDRPLHHDESLHGIYGKYFYYDKHNGFYQYNPLLHGPLLYHILPFIYKVLGISKFSLRILPLVLGSLLILSPLLMRRFLSKTAIILAMIWMALSPNLIYWSRFLRHDLLVIGTLFLMGVALTLKSTKRIYLFIISLSIHMCIKENYYVHIAIFLGFVIYQHFYNKFRGNQTSYLQSLKNIFIKYFKHVFLALFLSFIVYSYFYSAGFKYIDGIIDGLYRKSFTYWFHQHNLKRIWGPFIYQFLILSWYDICLIVLTFFHLIHFYLRAGKKYQIYLLFSSIISIIFYSIFLVYPKLISSPLFQSLNIIIKADIFFFILIPTHAIIITSHYLKHKYQILSIFSYLYFSSFFTYSFVGEKVPWLSLYPQIGGIFFLIIYFQNESKILEGYNYKKSISLLGITSFYLYQNININFSNSTLEKELINQVHTTKSYEDKLLKIQKQFSTKNHKTTPLVLAENGNSWPTSFYLYNEGNFIHTRGQTPYQKYDYIFTKYPNILASAKLNTTHRFEKTAHRVWWLPEYNNMTPYNYLKYLFFRTPWNPTGQNYISFYEKI